MANEAIAVLYGKRLAYSASGQAGVVPVSPTSVTFTAGVWTGNVTLTLADPTVALAINSGGQSATSNSFVVQAGAVSTFTGGRCPATDRWGAV